MLQEFLNGKSLHRKKSLSYRVDEMPSHATDDFTGFCQTSMS